MAIKLEANGIYFYDYGEKGYIGQSNRKDGVVARLEEHHKNAYGRDYANSKEDGTSRLLRESPLSFKKGKLKLANMSELAQGKYKNFYDNFSSCWEIEESDKYDFWEMIFILYFKEKGIRLTNWLYGSQKTFKLKPNIKLIKKNLPRVCKKIKGEKLTPEEYKSLEKILTEESVEIGSFSTRVRDVNSLSKMVFPAMKQLVESITKSVQSDFKNEFSARLISFAEGKYKNKDTFIKAIVKTMKEKYKKRYLKFFSVVQKLFEVEIKIQNPDVTIDKMSNEIDKFFKGFLDGINERYSNIEDSKKMLGKTEVEKMYYMTHNINNNSELKGMDDLFKYNIELPEFTVENTILSKDHWLKQIEYLELENLFEDATDVLKEKAQNWMKNIYRYARKKIDRTGQKTLYEKTRSHFKKKCNLKEEDEFLKNFSDFYIYQETIYNIESGFNFTKAENKEGKSSDIIYIKGKREKQILSFTKDTWEKIEKVKGGTFENIIW